MSGPWFAVDESDWEAGVSDLPLPWPLAFARMDLRHHENRARMKVGAFPGRVVLMARWGWTDRQVRRILDADDWHDSTRPVARADLRAKWDGVQQPANTPPSGCPTARQQDNGQTPANAEIPPTARQVGVQQPANSASIARSSSEPRSTTSTTSITPERANPAGSGAPPVAVPRLPPVARHLPPPAPAPRLPPPIPVDAPTSTRLTLDGRPVPADAAQLGIRPADAMVIVQYCDEPADLLWRTVEELGRWKGLGPPGAERIATACRRAGYPLGCVARPAPALGAPEARGGLQGRGGGHRPRGSILAAELVERIAARAAGTYRDDDPTDPDPTTPTRPPSVDVSYEVLHDESA